MRHGKKNNHLGRKAGHRRLMLSNMACSLIKYKRITTTLAKAKALRVYVEPILTKSKLDTTHSRRMVFKYLQNKYAVADLFKDISTRIYDRNGGYTRVIKLGHRHGDGAEIAMIELVDYNDFATKEKVTSSKKTRRKKKKIPQSDTENVTKSSKHPLVSEKDIAENIDKDNVSGNKDKSDTV